MPKIDDPLMNTADIAEYFRYELRQVQDMVNEPGFPSPIYLLRSRAKSSRRWRLSAIDAWLEGGRESVPTVTRQQKPGRRKLLPTTQEFIRL